MHSIIIFASGAGSNAQAIIDYFKDNNDAKVSLIVSNKKDAGVLNIAAKENIESLLINKKELDDATFVDRLQALKPSLIVLAGFLLKIPDVIIKTFPEKIINIHPSLLPKYGGKGMYGQHVHQAVLENKEIESGITIHYVNEVYDNGGKILQAYCPVLSNDTPANLAERIHQLEHFYYPRSINFLLKHM